MRDPSAASARRVEALARCLIAVCTPRVGPRTTLKSAPLCWTYAIVLPSPDSVGAVPSDDRRLLCCEIDDRKRGRHPRPRLPCLPYLPYLADLPCLGPSQRTLDRDDVYRGRHR